MVGSDHPWRQPRCMDWFNLESEITNPKGEFGYKDHFNELKEPFLGRRGPKIYQFFHF